MAELSEIITNVSSVLKVNQRLDIMLSKSHTEQYTSRIEEISDKTMAIAMPMSKGYPILLRPGIKFFGKVALAGAVYQFISAYIDKKMQPIPLWIIKKPDEMEKFQQRSFVRIDASIPIQIETIPENDDEEVQYFELISKDISGGGLKVVSKHMLKLGSKAMFSIDIPEVGLVQVKAEVIRCEQPQPDRPIFWIGFKFLDVNENMRSKIIRFIFKKQMELRQKGL